MSPAPFKGPWAPYSPARTRVETPARTTLAAPVVAPGYRSMWTAMFLYCVLQVVVVAWTIPQLFGLFS